MREISHERIEQTRQDILDTICALNLTHEQKISALANHAVSLMEVLNYPKNYEYYKEKGIICDLNEGNAPVRPRYIVPDYELLFEKGCEFLKLDPPYDLDEALNTLLIFYKNVPSVTNFPVFIGSLDKLLEPFVIKTDYEKAKKSIKLFLTHIDRTITDAFCHANIGPYNTVTGRIIIELERELQNAVPNLTLKYDENITPDDFAAEAVKTLLAVSKPAFANNGMFSRELGDNYAIASCYNGLLKGGGSYTLVRILLGRLAETAESIEDFFNNKLPDAIETMAAVIDERIRFIVEDSNFFEYNFLSKEGFISKDNFSAMFCIVGLAECVNTLMEKDGQTGRYGHSEEADNLAIRIMDSIDNFNSNHVSKYCLGTDKKILLHGQVGIDTDSGQTPTVRIPIGDEPAELSDHLMHCSKFHKYFPSGTGDIFPVETTANLNPEFVLDIIKGAFRNQVRYLTFHDSNADVIRVTGYLVKRSELEKLDKGEAVLQNTTAFGLGAAKKSKILERKHVNI